MRSKPLSAADKRFRDSLITREMAGTLPKSDREKLNRLNQRMNKDLTVQLHKNLDSRSAEDRTFPLPKQVYLYWSRKKRRICHGGDLVYCTDHGISAIMPVEDYSVIEIDTNATARLAEVEAERDAMTAERDHLLKVVARLAKTREGNDQWAKAARSFGVAIRSTATSFAAGQAVELINRRGGTDDFVSYLIVVRITDTGKILCKHGDHYAEFYPNGRSISWGQGYQWKMIKPLRQSIAENQPKA